MMMSETVTAPEADGKRQAPRRRMLMTGLVANEDLGLSFRCAIRDRSPEGARLKLPPGTLVPNRFWLIEASEGLAFDATVMWRQAPEVGVSLDKPVDLKEPMLLGKLHKRLHSLWVEVSPYRSGIS